MISVAARRLASRGSQRDGRCHAAHEIDVHIGDDRLPDRACAEDTVGRAVEVRQQRGRGATVKGPATGMTSSELGKGDLCQDCVVDIGSDPLK